MRFWNIRTIYITVTSRTWMTNRIPTNSSIFKRFFRMFVSLFIKNEYYQRVFREKIRLIVITLQIWQCETCPFLALNFSSGTLWHSQACPTLLCLLCVALRCVTMREDIISIFDDTLFWILRSRLTYGMINFRRYYNIYNTWQNIVYRNRVSTHRECDAPLEKRVCLGQP